jgi:hypothetical protein
MLCQQRNTCSRQQCRGKDGASPKSYHVLLEEKRFRTRAILNVITARTKGISFGQGFQFSEEDRNETAGGTRAEIALFRDRSAVSTGCSSFNAEAQL